MVKLWVVCMWMRFWYREGDRCGQKKQVEDDGNFEVWEAIFPSFSVGDWYWISSSSDSSVSESFWDSRFAIA